MAHSSEQRTNKKQTKQQPLEKFPYTQYGEARLGMIEVVGRPEGANYVGKALEKKKEKVQYHPPRGKP